MEMDASKLPAHQEAQDTWSFLLPPAIPAAEPLVPPNSAAAGGAKLFDEVSLATQHHEQRGYDARHRRYEYRLPLDRNVLDISDCFSKGPVQIFAEEPFVLGQNTDDTWDPSDVEIRCCNGTGEPPANMQRLFSTISASKPTQAKDTHRLLARQEDGMNALLLFNPLSRCPRIIVIPQPLVRKNTKRRRTE